MTKEEYEDIKNRIRKRYELEQMYFNAEIETFVRTGLIPRYPPEPLMVEILDCIAYGKKLELHKIQQL